MSFTIDLLDPTTRPQVPKLEGATDQHRRQGRRLALFHAMHLEQMARAHSVITRLEAGKDELGELGEALSELDLLRNYRLFGNICGQECRMLTGHHTIEDRYIFPVIAAGGHDGMRKVVERLEAEHGVIHDYIEQMEEAAIAVMQTPGPETFATLRAIFEKLETYVVSHFGYEEGALEEAIGYYGLDI